MFPAVCTAFLLWAAGAQGQAFSIRVLAEGLQEPTGVAVHPATGEIYVSEKGTGKILVLKNGRPEPALAAGWTVSSNLPKWAISAQVPLDKWMSAALQKPGAISISSNGTLFVAEQEPNGRILEFSPNEQGQLAVAKGVPVPWLDQEFQWRDLYVDPFGRLFVVGADEVGSDFMKFGSSLVRELDGNWWVIDFGPFANFGSFALSEKQDMMLLGDRNKGSLSWWEVNRHVMLGGSPEAAGRAELLNVAIFPDGAFVLGLQMAPGKVSLVRMDPFTGQQKTLTDELKSIGDIEMDRANARYLVTDPVAGRLLECTPSPAMKFNEAAMRQIVRSADGMLGGGVSSEAPAFLNTFFDRLKGAAEEIMPDGSTHSVQFNLSDIAGKMPVVAGRVRAAIEVEGAEEDPIEEVEFFLLFPSKVVMTETAVSPSLSFFSAKRKSGKVEQTKPVFHGDVGVYRLSGTNISKVASAPGGLHVPIVVCGMSQVEDGIHVNLSFLGAGIYGDYYLTLFQGPREQKAKLVVKSPTSASGNVTYEASFMEDAKIEGMDGSVTKEQLSNLLVSGFDGASGANRSVGWLRLGQFPASMTVAFGDAEGETKLTGAASGMKDIVEKKNLEMRMETATDIDALAPETAPPSGETPAPEAPSPTPAGETPAAAPEGP
ncbi:MAG TPA: hypothetical protein DCM68_00655 [Verrucomicrobia bacterium]|nr:hypothetical protein [Verrucomicrobiota bacterium]